MAEHGGYRQPTHPAPASGPGRLSRRTDGGPGQALRAPTGLPYGDNQALMDQERTAAMSMTDPVKPAQVPAAPQGGGASPQLPPFDAPSARPNEPITAGVDIGPGPSGLTLPAGPNPAAGTGQMTALLQRLSAQSTTGILGQLFQAAQARGA